MNDHTIEESRQIYEQSALKDLMEANDHEVCTRCYCCDLVHEAEPCFSCGGFVDFDDEWDDGYCGACDGEGTIYYPSCVGKCDEQGHHERLPNFHQYRKDHEAASGVNESASGANNV